MTGNYYSFDIPAALHQQIENYMGPSKHFATDFNLLYSVYSMPNIILPLFGGNIVDRAGAPACMVVFAFILFVGQVIFASGTCVRHWSIMLLGRVVYGLGGESISVASSTLASQWFEGKELAFSFGVNLAVSRLGSVINNMISPVIANAISTPFAMWVGAMINALSILSGLGIYLLERKAKRRCEKQNNANALLTASLLEDDRNKDNILGNDDTHSVSLNSLKSTRDKAQGEQNDKVRLRDVTRFGLSFWLLTLSCVVIYGCIIPFNNVASGILLQRNYFKVSTGNCELTYPGKCSSGWLVNKQNSGIQPDGQACSISKNDAPPLPEYLNITSTDSSWKHHSYVYAHLDSHTVDCGDPFWSKACTKDYCDKQKHATEEAARIMSIPYLMSAILSPFLGFFVDRVGYRAVIALLASVMLIGIHVTLAVSDGSPIVPLILQGFAYSMYAAVIWPSVPLIVDAKYIGTAFGVITSVQNIGLVSFPMIIAAIYNGSEQHYIPNVEYFFVVCASLGVLVGILLNIVDMRSGGKLNKVHREFINDDESNISASIPMSDDASYI
eukprot:CAMPEP_0197826808 /NCGR_PEP_ID=MMETSP1437-20131217/3707_1 /TAXON_ID=49252 ORGANISM="Eucampia antarctica, Strain CCMP1452" /NCGR_SAMPLE_ID=MMETSP1437 /ASSEMBLY_ACC=CAM_ASM_001096 /LENGTH=556 /DNA_ID=CAMNT_0043427397 /DNA_START=255 /DNA_END=1925 /DNA_ORIENTATION=+